MFSLDNVLDDLWPQARPAPWQKKLLKKLFYEEEFQQFADRHRHLKGLDTVEQVLEYLNIRCAIPAHDLEQIPEYGPLVIIANHPTGTLDGLALLYAVSRVRRDVKVVTNRMLTHLEPLSSLFIPVDNIHGRTAKAALQQMDQQLQAGGVLIFFPAGEVSRLTRRGIRDKKWHSGFIKLAAKYRAPLLPAWINARNSALFYASTLISDNLPLLLLMQQMFRRRNSSLPVRIGQQIPGRAGSMRSPALASLPAAAISTLNSCAKGCRGGLKQKAPSPVRKTGRCSNANCTRPNAWAAPPMAK
ncbi:hemolysin [Klebsiella pneumoniae]|nr:hemolysin [Klebsiella pneumoniae]